jgi:hypothetical protein
VLADGRQQLSIKRQAQAYPSNSIRQISGAFERAQHSAQAGI